MNAAQCIAPETARSYVQWVERVGIPTVMRQRYPACLTEETGENLLAWFAHSQMIAHRGRPVRLLREGCR